MGVPWGCRRVTAMSSTIAVSLKAHLMRWTITPIQARISNTCVGIVCTSDVLWKRRARLLPSYHETNSQAATFLYKEGSCACILCAGTHSPTAPHAAIWRLIMWSSIPCQSNWRTPASPHMHEIHSDVLMPNLKLPEVLWVGSSVSNTLKWYQNRRPLSQRIANAQNRRFLLLLSWDLVL